MTRDEIAKMTDEELRLEIAKAQGWDKIRRYRDRWTGEHDTEEWGVTRDRIPEYPLEISGAWELVEEMGELENVTVELCNHQWECRTDDYARTIYGHGKTAPRAICEAWLMWKDAQG